MSLYKDPIAEKVIDNLKAVSGFNSLITTYHYGDPLFVPKSDLPVLIIQKDTSEISDLTNAEDQHKLKYVIIVITDIRDFFKETQGTEKVHVGYQRLEQIIEDRDTDFTLKSTSLIDILRTNVNLGNNAHIDAESVTLVRYGATLGLRGENSWAMEAVVEFTVFFNQLR